MIEDKEGDMEKIHNDMVLKILEYLKTGNFAPSGNAYATAYQ